MLNHAPEARLCSNVIIQPTQTDGLTIKLAITRALGTRELHVFLVLTLAKRAVILVFVAVIPRSLAAAIGDGRAEQILIAADAGILNHFSQLDDFRSYCGR